MEKVVHSLISSTPPYHRVGDSNVRIVQTHNIWQYKKSLKISKTVSL